MTDDELQAMGADFLQALHARIDGMEDGSVKRFFNRQARIIHGALETIEDKALSLGLISAPVAPMSGGGDK